MFTSCILSKNLFYKACFTLLVISLSACQSKLAIVGEEHQTSGEKWQALAQYASSTLSKYGVKITTKLNVDKLVTGSEVVLGNIRLNNKEDHFNVDLLMPTFEQKYICTPLCLQLVEYSNYYGKDANTLLSKYFDKHEFELFQFYSDIYVLDAQLTILAKYNAFLITDYLQWVATTEQSFASLSEFIVFLQDKITVESYQHFIDNPNVGYANLVENYFVHPENAWRNETPTDPTSELWKSDVIAPETAFWAEESTLPEAGNWFYRVQEDGGKDESVDFWSDAKKLSFGPGDSICTYNNNFFGIVKSLSSTQVVVSVMGQSKKIIDGVTSDVNKGELFRAVSGSTFLPIDELKTFAKADVALCHFQ